MGQVRHGSATTTHAVRAAIQRSQASIGELSRELGSKEVQKTIWGIVFPTNTQDGCEVA